jgi:ankyrin repeat protein
MLAVIKNTRMTISEKYFTACYNGDLDTVKVILKTYKLNIGMISPEGWTGLIIACFNENFKIAKFLIENNADVNATNLNGTSVFMYAKTPVQQNQENIKILVLLLNGGADINHLDSYNKSVLDYVIDNGAFELGKWMISKGAKHGVLINQQNNINSK